MPERLFIPGKLTDLTDPRQLAILNQILTQLLSVYNLFDQNSFALSWIEGAAAGQVIVSKGTGNAPEWEASPTLTGGTFSGLTASQMVHTSAAKALVSVAPTGTYTPTNVTPDRSFDADTVLIAELADVVGTLIADLKVQKIIG